MDIISDYLSLINTNGYKQFRLEIISDSASSESIINFFNGDTTEFEGPYLDIYYGDDIVSSNILNKNTVSLNLFPNPVNDVLNVSYSKEFKPVQYQIIQQDGKIIQQKTINALRTFDINVNNLAAGMYQLKLINQFGDFSINNFVKQ